MLSVIYIFFIVFMYSISYNFPNRDASVRVSDPPAGGDGGCVG